MGAPKLVAKKEIKISICPFFSFFLPTGAKIFMLIAINPRGLYGKLPVEITVSRSEIPRTSPCQIYSYC